ncbi:MFS transporter [Actinosynnema sp. ALI-1.44]|uniref:MFS transporter n=1 Tax=Actinosynnema sp. ALI-1.44 TaxID=1933779 RepID=UPI00097BC077|nr:MFS transporter [Actinosynnema sp. ALI-1.44]ONI90819.1 MFS transporter [Actinosynnema sp. ALI-1.44]
MTAKQVTATPAPVRWDPRLWGLLFVLSGNMLLDALEVSVVIVAMPSIGDDLNLGIAALQWTMSGFALGFGGLLLFGGRVVALLGRRRMYLIALLVFAAASLVGALADNGALLTATRFVKGFCVALTAPTGLAIIGNTFREGPARNRAMSIYSLFGASGFSLGLLLSGALTQVSWRWTFLFPVPVAIALFALGLRLIPRDKPGEDTDRRYDLAGAGTFVAAMLLLVHAIVTGPEIGWGHPRTVGAFALTALLAAGFVVIERSVPRPLVRFGVFTNRALMRSALGAAALNGAYWGFLLVCTFQLQSLLDWTPWQVGLAILPASMLLTLAAPFSGRMVGRFGAARLIALGAAAPPAGYILWLSAGTPSTYAADVLPTMLLVGLGFLLAFSPLHVQAIAGIRTAERGMASGAYQTAVQLGGAVMLALVAALLVANEAPEGASADAVSAGYRPALLLIIAAGVAGLLVALTGLFPRGRLPVSSSGERTPDGRSHDISTRAQRGA